MAIQSSNDGSILGTLSRRPVSSIYWIEYPYMVAVCIFINKLDSYFIILSIFKFFVLRLGLSRNKFFSILSFRILSGVGQTSRMPDGKRHACP